MNENAPVDNAPVDLDEYLGKDWQKSEPSERKANLVTFYYPATPEDTKKARLSYSMEGGIQGGAGFSDVDLRNHTLEKFKEGKSRWVAVAMPGKPTGEIFRTTVRGEPIIGKWVDTGGGLRSGQMDIATENPDLARGYVERNEDGDAPGLAGAPSTGRQVEPIELPELPTTEAEAKPTAAPVASKGFTAAPIPELPTVKPVEPLDIPAAAPTTGQIPTQLGNITPPEFTAAVQQTIAQTPERALIAGDVTQAAVQSAEGDPPPFDVEEFLGEAIPTQTPRPATPPTVGAAAPRSPVVGERVEKTAHAVVNWAKQMVPQSQPELLAALGEAPSAEPQQILQQAAEKAFPQLKGAKDLSQQVINRVKQIAASEQTPAESQERYDAGVATVLDLVTLAVPIKIGKGIGKGKGSVRAEPQPNVAATNAALGRMKTAKDPFPQERYEWLIENAEAPKEISELNFLNDRLRGMATDFVSPDKPPAITSIEMPAGKRASILHTPKTILNRVFGNGIGDKLEFAENHALALLGKNVTDLRKSGFAKLDKFELENLRNVAEGTDVPMNNRVKRVSEVWDRIRKEDAADYLAKGAKVQVTPKIRDEQTGLIMRKADFRDFVPRDNYAPQYVDLNRVANAPATFADDIAKLNPSLGLQKAIEVANYLRAEARGEGGLHITDPKLLQIVRGGSHVPTHLHARSSLELPKYVYESVRESIPKYLAESAKERGYLEAFGPEFDLAIQDAVTNLGPRRTNVKLAEEQWDKFRGRHIESESGIRIKQTANTLNNLATATLLGPLTAVSQISQLGVVATKMGLRRMAIGMIKAATRDGRLRAQEAGSFVNSLIDDYAVVTKTTPTAGKLKKAEKASAYLASKVVKFSGIEKMDHFPRVVAFHAAESEIKALMRKAAHGNKRAERRLTKHGLGATSTEAQIAEAAASVSKKYNLSTRFSDLPAILQTPTGSFARGLNTFNVQMSRLLWKEFLKPAMKGNPVPLLKLLTAQIMIGEVIGETRRWLTGRTGDRPGGSLPEFLDDVVNGRKTSMEIAHRALDDISWSGTLGFAQQIYQGLAWATSGTEGGSRMLSAISGAGISNALETLAGAGYEFGMAGGAAARSQTGGSKEREDARQEMERRLQTGGRILTRRIPVVGGIVAPRVFRSEKADRRMAASAIKRAKKRGDPYASMHWRGWFKDRHPGSNVSRSAVENAKD